MFVYEFNIYNDIVIKLTIELIITKMMHVIRPMWPEWAFFFLCSGSIKWNERKKWGLFINDENIDIENWQ